MRLRTTTSVEKAGMTCAVAETWVSSPRPGGPEQPAKGCEGPELGQIFREFILLIAVPAELGSRMACSFWVRCAQGPIVAFVALTVAGGSGVMARTPGTKGCRCPLIGWRRGGMDLACGPFAADSGITSNGEALSPVRRPARGSLLLKHWLSGSTNASHFIELSGSFQFAGMATKLGATSLPGAGPTAATLRAGPLALGSNKGQPLKMSPIPTRVSSLQSLLQPRSVFRFGWVGGRVCLS